MKPHRMDEVSLSFGLIFVAITLWWALSRAVAIHLPNPGWLIAGALIFFGVVGLLGAIRSGRRADPVAAEADVETPGDLPPQMQGEIVQELLDDPAERFEREQHRN